LQSDARKARIKPCFHGTL